MSRLTSIAALCLLASPCGVTAARAWDDGPLPTTTADQTGAAPPSATPVRSAKDGSAAPATQSVVSRDPKAAVAGTYRLDINHTSIIARVGHGGGFSYATVRFGATEGSLTWDPANVASSKLKITVDMTPYYAPIVYAMDPKEAAFLNTADFPSATFTSSAVRVTGPTTCVVTGSLTFRGQTRLVTIATTLVGAGVSGGGAPKVGFTGVMKFKRSDFGSSFALDAVSDDIELVLDAEFGMPALTAPAT